MGNGRTTRRHATKGRGLLVQKQRSKTVVPRTRIARHRRDTKRHEQTQRDTMRGAKTGEPFGCRRVACSSTAQQGKREENTAWPRPYSSYFPVSYLSFAARRKTYKVRGGQTPTHVKVGDVSKKKEPPPTPKTRVDGELHLSWSRECSPVRRQTGCAFYAVHSIARGCNYSVRFAHACHSAL